MGGWPPVEGHGGAPVGAEEELFRADVGVGERLFDELGPPEADFEEDVVEGAGDVEGLIHPAFEVAGLEAAVVEDEGDIGELGRQVGDPEDVDRFRHGVVGEGVALDDAGVDAGGDAVLAGDLEDDAHFVEALGHADRLTALAAGGVAGDPLADADELAGGEELVDLLGRCLDRPLDLTAHRLVMGFARSTAGDELIRVLFDELRVDLVREPLPWQEDAHIDAVAFHVVEEARGVVIGGHVHHRLREIGIARAALETWPSGEALSMDMRVDNEPTEAHGILLTLLAR